MAVTVAKHELQNKIKGSIRHKNQLRYKVEEIYEALKYQRVVDLYQVNKKVCAERVSASIYIVAFECCNLPEDVTIGWTLCSVREYALKAQHCFKCHKFGHGRLSYRAYTSICNRCCLSGNSWMANDITANPNFQTVKNHT